MKTKEKWYNSAQMVGTLLIFWPPVGIYGVFKSETIQPKWKKATYGAFTLALIMFVIVYLS